MDRLVLDPQDRTVLQRWQRATTMPQGLVKRARLLLLLADGLPVSRVATMVDMERRHVYKWVERYQKEGMAGLRDHPGRGRPRKEKSWTHSC